MNKRHLNHSAKVLSGFLESGENASAFFEPTDKLFNDRPSPVGITVESNGSGIRVFIALGRDDRLHVQLQQILVNPIGAIAFVSSHSHRPCDWIAIKINHRLICSLQQRGDCGRFVSLAGSQMEMKRVTVPIGKDVDFRRKTPTGAA